VFQHLEGTKEVLLQVLIDSLIYSSELALLALGVTMVYGALRFPNFAHVEFATLGAYLAFVLSAGLGAPLYVALLIAAVMVGVVGVGIDLAVFRKLRQTSPILLMIASFGIGIALREAIRAIWGTSPVFFPLPLQRPLQLWWDMSATPVQIAIILVAAVCVYAFHLLLNRTKLGIAMRSLADNPNLAEASGINTERIIRSVWLIGAGMAGLGGVMIGLDTQIHPNMGFAIIIPVFCAAILGGIGNPYGALLGALVVAFAQNVGLSIDWAPLASILGWSGESGLYIPTGYKAAIPFGLLILCLLLRPQGLMGDPNR
jgi:branched-subunit amino acid ABC-type transport system permease component